MKHIVFYSQKQVEGLFALGFALSFVLGLAMWWPSPSIQLPDLPHFSFESSLPPTPCLEINQADSSQWDSLPGIGKVLSKRIVAYRNHLGGFRSIADLQAVYGLKDSVVAQLEPFLYVEQETINRSAKRSRKAAIPQQSFAQKKSPVYATKAKKKYISVELNEADSVSLDALPGIGPKLARRILKYRNILGFYWDVSQLRAVYGLSEENYQRMAPHLSVRPPQTPPLKDLNTANEWLIARLAFWEKEEAQALLALRKELGRFDRWEELQAIQVAHPKAHEELRNYFFL